MGMNIDGPMKEALRPFIHAHCNGCDEYLCDHVEGYDEGLLNKATEAAIRITWLFIHDHRLPLA